jgi:hypothetical protein
MLKGKAEQITPYRSLRNELRPPRHCSHSSYAGGNRQFTAIVEGCLEFGLGRTVYVRADAGSANRSC